MQTIARRMISVLNHRGPDDSGIWIEGAMAMAHARLSIIDLSENGHQPMLSSAGRYAIVFNGEIYNHKALAAELIKSGVQFRGHSDTEVLLSSMENWGIVSAVQQAVGMFAMAVWDRQEKELCLIRDRMGEKPLYYGWQDNTLIFASELRSFREYPGFDTQLNLDALSLYLRFGYVPGPHSIYQGVHKLPPGTILRFPAKQGASRPAITNLEVTKESQHEPIPYWSVKDAANRGLYDKILDANQAVSDLEELLCGAIRNQLVAEVPLGAFLSGGVDSSTVVALMCRESRNPVRTFTIGFDETEFNEAEHAKAVARHLGTDHTELYLTARDALDVVPQLQNVYDEPFADSSQIPSILVAKMARRNVTVALSGDGGDELFCGYNRYLWTKRLWAALSAVPEPLRLAAGKLLLSISPERLESILSWTKMSFLSAQLLESGKSGARLHKLGASMGSKDAQGLYESLISYWKSPGDILVSKKSSIVPWQNDKLGGNTDFVAQMQYWDQIGYLPDDNLVKVDRASMRASLEVRAPLLDHRVVEYSWRLPMRLRVRNGQSKWLLRQVLYRHVPKSLIDRPKMGFSVPVASWLRGSLRPWAEELLDHSTLRKDGIFDVAAIRKVWDQHLSGAIDAHNELWTILMFQAWQKQHRSSIH
jgi:asparagine synthase (glutamine-hydrolysing)